MNPIESIHVAPTTEKKTEPGRFENALRTAGARLVQGVATGVELAAPYVPAGTVLSAAVIRPAAASVAGAIASSASSAASSASAGAATSGAGAGVGGSEGDLLEATRALQSEARTFNLQYLQLQDGMQRESREFTALSNIMKVRHDSAKSAIGNIH
jgi:type IV secretory pathway TrbL component